VSAENHGGEDDDGDDDAGWRELLTPPPKLPGNSTSRDIWEEVRGMDEREFCLSVSEIRQRIFNVS
jgi:hypothetical protein